MQWENAAADKLLRRLSPRQRALQTWAAYGSFPLRDGRAEIRWPGCMGAVRQPIYFAMPVEGSDEFRAESLNDLVERYLSGEADVPCAPSGAPHVEDGPSIGRYR